MNQGEQTPQCPRCWRLFPSWFAVKRHLKYGCKTNYKFCNAVTQNKKGEQNKMLTAKPFVPNVNVEDVPPTGLTIIIKEVGETSAEVKAKIENAKEFTIEFISDKLDKKKFPEGRAQRMFSATSDLAKKLSILSGQKENKDGTYQIDETKLPGKTATLVRAKSAGKFSNQDTLTLK
jgi:hypothetical protein